MKVGRPHYDVAILGSGFAGSILARALTARGRRVLLIERHHHPRFSLGESSTPLAALSLERLAARYRLQDLHHLAAYGRWTEHLPHLRRGKKRGFTFYAHRRHERYANSEGNEARLLAAASPNDTVADSHWLRSDVDHHLVQRAVDEGVELREGTRVQGIHIESEGVRLELFDGEAPSVVEADYVVDASGPAGVLSRQLGLRSRLDAVTVDTGILFAHFEHVAELSEVAPAWFGRAPYPEEASAVHHLLDIGWLYVLRFDHGPASVGLLLRDDRRTVARERLAADPDGAFRSLLADYPSLAASFAEARPTTAVRYMPRIQHRLGRVADERWFLLPHAYVFYDPIFSTGMAWSLVAVERLASLLTGEHGDWQTYARVLVREAEQIEALIESAYRSMDDFERFAAIVRLYLVTASWSETVQRLLPSGTDSVPDAWAGFLGTDDPILRSLFVQSRDRLRRLGPAVQQTELFVDWLASRTASRDLVGLDTPAVRNLHPADLDILIRRSHLLGLQPEEVFAALPRLRGEVEA
ncbi:MAG: FAD-dependent oxidoreductase [Acidobacteriota bacterium]